MAGSLRSPALHDACILCAPTGSFAQPARPRSGRAARRSRAKRGPPRNRGERRPSPQVSRSEPKASEDHKGGPPMKFGVAFANVGPYVQPQEAAFLAKSCEEAGIESLWTVEHVAVPTGYRAQYPYSADGRMPGPEDSPIPDPLIWLAYVAAATSRIKLATGILILPQRHPIYVAKEVATLDVLSKGRALLGIGIGWMEDEFRALGIPFDERVARTEEACAALRTLWKPGAHAFKSDHYAWEALESNPKPVQPGGVPIIVGGHVLGA